MQKIRNLQIGLENRVMETVQAALSFIEKGRQGGTFIYHLLQNLKVPGSNFDKDLKFIKLVMR